jgi:hypothetical protein
MNCIKLRLEAGHKKTGSPILSGEEAYLLSPSKKIMAATTTTTEPIMHDPDVDRIEKKPQLSHTTTNISLSPELFEKLYLSPKVPHASENVAKYANATPLGFLGYGGMKTKAQP